MTRWQARRAARARGRRIKRVQTWGLSGIALVMGVGLAVVVTAGGDDGGPPVQSYELTGRPSAIVVSEGVVWVADDESMAIHVIDPETGRASRTLDVSRNPIGLTAGDRSVWVAHGGGEITRIDARSLDVSAPVVVGESATGIAFGFGRVWVTDLVARQLLEVDPRTSRVVQRTSVPAGVVRVAVAGERLWLTNDENTAAPVDPETGAVGEPRPVGPGPIGLASDGASVWVASSESGTVARLDAGTGRPAGDPVAVGEGPIAVAAGSRDVWVLAQDSREVVRIDAGQGTIAARHRLPMRPRGLALGEGAVWVVGVDPGAVVRINV